ncbi:MAG: immunoglobulin-like domain-containing protein [Tissierella sp.]|uniref:immunoglobulin-like domain-containing protein n=1 Tax=Tissierella sp. TaxID=41274 RepID=UPI003F9CB8E9
MIKKRLDKILNTINTKPSKSLIIILIISILGASFLIGCDNKDNIKEKVDELYESRTEYVGDNSKVGNIVAKIEWPEGFTYDSMEISTDSEDNTLILNFDVDKKEDFTVDKFTRQSAILFSLIDNLDELVYIQTNKEVEGSILLSREYIDNMTIAVVGAETEYIGENKEDFKKIVEETTILLDSRDEEELKPTEYEKVNNVKDVIMTTKEGTVDQKGLTLIFDNKSDTDYIYSNDFVIEKKRNGKWYKLPVKIDGDFGFKDIGYGLDSGLSREFKLEWGWLYGELKEGEYRLIKSITDLRGPEDFDSYYLAAEFNVY